MVKSIVTTIRLKEHERLPAEKEKAVEEVAPEEKKEQ